MAFKKTISSLGLLVLVGQFSIAEDHSEKDIQSFTSSMPNGVSSGDTTQNTTVLWARSILAGNVHFQIKKDDGVVTDNDISVKNPNQPVKLNVDSLQADKDYTYTVTAPDGQAITGRFKTAPESYFDKGLRFGVSGDWRGELAPYPAIKNVNSKALDFFVKLGDTIYADIPSPVAPQGQVKTLDEFRAKHQEVYASYHGINSFADLQRSLSVFSTIDDHEVINDFAGGSPSGKDQRFPESGALINQTVLYKNGLQAFAEYNAVANKTYPVSGDHLTDGRPDLYRNQRYGKTAAIYLLDARSFRDQELAGVVNITDELQIGSFIARSFDAGQVKNRTMLGRKQLTRLKSELIAAEQDGVTWKFVMLPEPIQNLGVFGASDRYEGYASERSELLRFIDENQIKNVVFVAADIHGTVINDLTFQRREDILTALATSGNPLAAPQQKTSAFEITTGSVAFAPAFGDAISGLLAVVPGGNLLLQSMLARLKINSLDEFKKLPMTVKDMALQELINTQLNSLGYSPIGLQDNTLIKAKLLQGSNVALFLFGWTQFEIKPEKHTLIITTYGIEPYTAEDMSLHSNDIIKRQPKVISQLLVSPQR